MEITNNNTNSKIFTKEEIAIDKQIGERISSRCKALNIDSVELSKRLKLSKGSVDGYRAGRVTLKANRLDTLCKILKCDANYLINGNADIVRRTGMTENACRMLTGANITDCATDIETSQNTYYSIPKVVGENKEEFESRSYDALVEIQGVLSWLIEHGLIEVLAEMCSVESEWRNNKKLKSKAYNTVVSNYLLYQTEDSKYVINESLRIEKEMQALIEHYISKSFEERR